MPARGWRLADPLPTPAARSQSPGRKNQRGVGALHAPVSSQSAWGKAAAKQLAEKGGDGELTREPHARPGLRCELGGGGCPREGAGEEGPRGAARPRGGSGCRPGASRSAGRSVHVRKTRETREGRAKESHHLCDPLQGGSTGALRTERTEITKNSVTKKKKNTSLIAPGGRGVLRRGSRL